MISYVSVVDVENNRNTICNISLNIGMHKKTNSVHKLNKYAVRSYYLPDMGFAIEYSNIYSIFPTLRECLPPSNFSDKKTSTIPFAISIPVVRPPIAKTFALLCFRDMDTV